MTAALGPRSLVQPHLHGAVVLTPAQQGVLELWLQVVDAAHLTPNAWQRPDLYLQLVYGVPDVSALDDRQAADATRWLTDWLIRLRRAGADPRRRTPRGAA